MLSLAAFRYRNILASDGGPIERVEGTQTTILGTRLHLANAYLVGCLAGNREGSQLYSRANGSGTHASAMVARHMAISEALERWAHWQLHASAEAARYGFDIDPSTNGLAAFPGWWQRQARAGAQMEAAERFNVLHWWEGRLPAAVAAGPWPGVQVVTIRSLAPGVTVIVFRREEAGFYSYGHAAASDYATACRKAGAEMERHAKVVGRFASQHEGRIRGVLPPDAHPIERRSLFFASEEGHALFLERVRAAPARPEVAPKLVFDGPVPGPWSRYADVWRVLYEPPSRRFLGMDENYFYL
jgi:hypothetical protein